MNDQVVTNSKSKLKLILLAVFVIIAILLVILNRTGKKVDEQALVPAIVIPTPVILTEGALLIQAPTTSIGTAAGAQEIDIIASSNQRSIVAYDIVVSYEKGALEVLSVESLLPDFKVYPLEKNNYFVITGVKELKSNSNSVFDKLPIARLKVLVKKKSALTLKVVESLGKERSQMVDSESKILRPEVGELKLNIN